MVPVHFFFFNDTATTEIYTLSLHDALPIYVLRRFASITHASWSTSAAWTRSHSSRIVSPWTTGTPRRTPRSEEHTSELQSRQYLVCRLLLEKKIRMS